MLIKTIKADQLQARKNRDKIATSLLTTLIGEADTAAKNKGVELLDDASTIALIQKFLNNIQIVFDASGHNETAQKEMDLLKAYLPTKLTDAELESEIKKFITGLRGTVPDNKLMGEVLKSLKSSYPGRYDGATASALVKKLM